MQSIAARFLPSVARRVAAAPAVHMPARTLASLQESLRTTPETKITTLKNGLRVASENTGHLSATVGLWIDTGSRFETEQNNGVAHFLEHMFFKGTKRRTQQGLEAEVESIGASLNAYTSREQTVYYAKVLNNNVNDAVDLLADILQNSKFDADAINAERDVILREMQEVSNQREEVLYDHLHSVAYQGYPLGRTILGPTENILKLSRDDITDYVRKHYTAPRIVLAAAGGIDHDVLVKQAEKQFGDLSSTASNDRSFANRFTGADVRDRNDDIDVGHIALAIEGVGWAHADFIPLLVASTMIGNWNRLIPGKNLASKLTQRVVAENLANSYQAFNTAYKDTALWGVQFVAPRDKVEDMTFEVQAELMRLCTSATEAEVARAKNLLRTSLFLNLDGTTLIAEEIGRHVLNFGRRIPIAEINARIEAVNASVIREVLNKYVYDKCPAVAGIGAIEGLPDYNRIRGGMSWLRV
ncbi:peptidase beta [Capsaspora owczarzaki ATCC 30864]|uniref:mitochondrial processing peptidase n=1 Tax=Capsaspora owczarzaki (strain ATCC 30864) TaxID=595528 RepID=A0A0D2WM58_CAPO3|nr:peptidase beta [Capsaspora owczarzaki ATCC 30864]KJE91163.1 peptidase beta [Capsaspora owczarzaki ATCC 30864]|eukprot:XP_004349090.1 peptidase beta [Capsaspora owczarzaki ATCC 30864]